MIYTQYVNSEFRDVNPLTVACKISNSPLAFIWLYFMNSIAYIAFRSEKQVSLATSWSNPLPRACLASSLTLIIPSATDRTETAAEYREAAAQMACRRARWGNSGCDGGSASRARKDWRWRTRGTDGVMVKKVSTRCSSIATSRLSIVVGISKSYLHGEGRVGGHPGHNISKISLPILPASASMGGTSTDVRKLSK